MFPIASALIEPGQILGAALSLPLVSLVLAAIITMGMSVAARRSPRHPSQASPAGPANHRVVARHSREHVVLGGSAIAVIVIFLVENLVSGYLLNLNGVVSWWRYATPVFTACVGLASLLAVILFRGTAPERPVVPTARRTWLTFSSRLGSSGTGLVVLVLTVTTIAAGLASSSIGDGPHVFLEIGIPNENIDPIRLWFYGWAYGVPVLICVLLLAAVGVSVLHANAARPFLRPETVIAEQYERREIATGITSVAASAALLALAGAWRFIADAGSTTQLIIQGEGRSESYEATWRYAEIAAVGGWLAPALEIAAFVILLLTVSRAARASRAAAHSRNSAGLQSAR
ncbi:hypothetical protein [Microbacterium sp. SA39]|uniref:hypothetical protein n=1 Tax=Microbacterium sp. SA39 TaxID=1263625 RepID=UPI00061F12DE|nr:hypothetical protein [Microbacterium sp. SA39]KJQ55214.1 hypothetical protein RS85_00989 [Microbacterium sp. SA39]